MLMTKRTKKRTWVAIFATGAVGFAFVLTQMFGLKPVGQGEPPPLVAKKGVSDPSRISPFGEMQKSDGTNGGSPRSTENGWLSAIGSAGQDSPESPLSTMSPPSFAADSRGELIVNADTRNNIEKLLLQDTPEALQAQLKEVSKDLPVKAAERLRSLLSSYQQYSTALSQSIPPGEAPATEQEGIRLLERMRVLRTAYLGAETTQAIFGEEEEMTRHILKLMQNESDPNLTLEQKAARAQEALSKMPAPTASGAKR